MGIAGSATDHAELASTHLPLGASLATQGTIWLSTPPSASKCVQLVSSSIKPPVNASFALKSAFPAMALLSIAQDAQTPHIFMKTNAEKSVLTDIKDSSTHMSAVDALLALTATTTLASTSALPFTKSMRTPTLVFNSSKSLILACWTL